LYRDRERERLQTRDGEDFIFLKKFELMWKVKKETTPQGDEYLLKRDARETYRNVYLVAALLRHFIVCLCVCFSLGASREEKKAL